LRHVGLSPEDRFLGIKAQGDVIRRDIERMLRNISGRGVAGKGVVIRDKVETLVPRLHLQVLAYCAEKVAYVQFA
jgi:hypothetical protein